jgi:hypothetical protein
VIKVNERALVYGPTRLSQRFASFTAADWRMAILIVTGLFTLNVLYNNSLLNIAAFLVGILIMWKFSPHGRLYYVVGQAFYSAWVRYWQHGIRWQANPPKGRFFRRLFTRISTRWSSDAIPLEVNELGEIGLIHNHRQQTDSVIVGGTGSLMSGVGLDDQRDILDLHDQWMKRVAGRPDVGVSISFVYRVDPHDPWQDIVMQVETGLPNIVLPPELAPETTADEATRSRWAALRANLLEVNQLGLEVGSDVHMAAVITIKRYGRLQKLTKDQRKRERQLEKRMKREWQKEKRRAKREKREPIVHDEVVQQRAEMARLRLSDLPIADLADECAKGLEASGVSGVHVFNVPETERFLRGSWDVSDMDDYYERRLQNELGGESHWPSQRIVVTKRAVVFDNTAHATLLVKNLPSPLLPHFMTQLHKLGIEYPTITLVGETTNSIWDYFALSRLHSITRGAQDAFGAESGYKTAQVHDEWQARQAQLANTKYLHLYNILIDIRRPVAGTSWEDLESIDEQATRVIKDLRSGPGIEAIRVKGECRQESVVWSTTGINML